MRTFKTLAELADCVGQEVAVSDWQLVTQQMIDQFAQATGDHQWIHLDEARAKAGPFGTTIAHGFLTLSMIPAFSHSALTIEDVRMGINYGLNKVRFTSPVPVQSRLRARFKLLGVEPIEGGRQLNWSVTVEREGSDKPVCIAETIARQFA